MTNPSLPTIGPETLPQLMQPYVRLAQRNLQLFTEFSVSPEMLSLWLTSSQQMFGQAVRSTATGKNGEDSQKVVKQLQKNVLQTSQSKAFGGLMQGLMQSHMQFLADLAQSSMSALSQGPAKLMEQMQHAASNALPMPGSQEKEEPNRSGKPKAH